MNQILETTKNRNKILKLLKIQGFMSILGFLVVIFFVSSQNAENSSTEKYSKSLGLTAQIASIYNAEETNYSNIFGKIEIPKIALEYSVFNEFSEELMKISPCKFYGNSIEKTGNIAIVGHNYDNHTFFSDINKLEEGDEIYLYSNDNLKYTYTVYEKYETDEDDLDCLKAKFLNSRELTLITCNNSNKKRFIVKAISV